MSHEQPNQPGAVGQKNQAGDELHRSDSFAPFALIQVHLLDEHDQCNKSDPCDYRARYEKLDNILDSVDRAVRLNRHNFLRYLVDVFEFFAPAFAFFSGFLFGFFMNLGRLIN